MINLSFFRNARPALEAHLIEAGEGQSATNCRFETGALAAFQGNVLQQAISLVGTAQTIYRYSDSFWLEFTSDVDLAPPPVASDTENTVYYTGTDRPRVTDATQATSGSAPYPTVSDWLGVPFPENPFTVLVTGTADPEDQDPEYLRYVMTFVNGRDQEGPPSAASGEVEKFFGQSVSLSDLPVAPSGQWNINRKRLYRRASASGDGAYLFLAELGIATTTYTDSIATEALDEPLVSGEWYPPPENMVGLTALANSTMAGFFDNQACLSEAGVPSAWPPGYRIATQDPIVAIAGITGGFVIATTGQPYLVQFTNPASAAYERLETPRGCLSKRSMVDMGDWAIYAAGDGLVAIGGGREVPVITTGVLTPQQWRKLNPETVHGYRLDNLYVGFYDGEDGPGGFVIDPRGQGFSWLDFYADAGYTDPRTGYLYLVIDGNIVRWDADPAAKLSYAFLSGTTLTPQPMCPAYARVDAESYPAIGDGSLVFRLYGDGVLRYTKAITGEAPFPLPAGYLARRFEVELSGTRATRRALVALSPEEMT